MFVHTAPFTIFCIALIRRVFDVDSNCIAVCWGTSISQLSGPPPLTNKGDGELQHQHSAIVTASLIVLDDVIILLLFY